MIPLIAKFSFCSTIEQSYTSCTVVQSDLLVYSTVTTTRKILSALLSICLKGHNLTKIGWIGITIAISEIASKV